MNPGATASGEFKTQTKGEPPWKIFKTRLFKPFNFPAWEKAFKDAAPARSVRQLVDHCGKTPYLIAEDELRDYFLRGIDESNRAPPP